MSRRSGRLAALLILLAASGAPAQSVLYAATVSVPEAEVRSGAGETEQLYPTNRVRSGDVVEVVKVVSNEWLGIKPPRGSFSWISTRFIQSAHPDQTLWTVHTRTAVLMGSTVRADKPTVEGARVDPGTILRSIGQARQSEDGLWLPVEPPPAEVRYIRATAVTRNNPGTPTPVTPTTLPPNMTTGTGATPPASGGLNDPRWLKAQQAEQANNFPEAIRLYTEFANQIVNTDHPTAVKAYSRAEWLKDRTRSMRPGTTPPQPQRTDVRYPVPTTSPAPAPAPGVTPTPAPPVSGSLPQGWTLHLGTLREHPQPINAQKAYILWGSTGRPLTHVVAGPGVNLASYVNRNVELAGPKIYDNNQRADVMTAMQVKLLP